MFLRTRVARAGRLVLPRYAVVTAAAIGALAASTGVAWATTAALIGGALLALAVHRFDLREL